MGAADSVVLAEGDGCPCPGRLATGGATVDAPQPTGWQPAHFLKRLREAVPDIDDIERIDNAEPGTARYPSDAGRNLFGRW